MKNVEMNAGMQEMSMAEMESVNGGLWHGILVFLAVDILTNPEAAYDALRDGWNSVR